LSEYAGEGVESYGVSCISGTARDLDSDGHGGEEHPCSDCDGEVEEDPSWDGGGWFEVVEESASEGCESPADPDGPAPAPGGGAGYADNNGAGLEIC